MFDKLLTLKEAFSEAVEAYRNNFSLIIVVSLLGLGLGLIPKLLSHVYNRRLDYTESSTSVYIGHSGAYAVPDLPSGIELIGSILIIPIMIVIGFVFTQKLLQYYFEDQKRTKEQIIYAIPRAFRWFCCGLLTWVVIFVPMSILMAVVGFITISSSSTFVSNIISIIMLVIISPTVIAISFMKYKIIIDDTGIIVSFKKSFALTFKYISKFLPVILMGGIVLGLTVGADKGFTLLLENPFWAICVSNYFISLLWILLTLVLLIQYINIDWYENQDSFITTED